jgi:hypothetical protein
MTSRSGEALTNRVRGSIHRAGTTRRRHANRVHDGHSQVTAGGFGDSRAEAQRLADHHGTEGARRRENHDPT